MADHEIYEDRIALEHVRRQLSTDSEDFPDEILDPRIQIELEKLNKASEDINKLELELDDARGSFRQALSESTQKLNALAKKLGACVEKARPYYDSRVKAKEIHMETQKVALRYERACSMHEAAKEMVQLAEQGYMHRGQTTDPAWQEMLNHATMKVNEAEKERNESESEHQKTTQLFKFAEERVQFLQKDLKRAIAKSNLSTRRSFLQLSSIANQHWLECLPYFEMKIKFNQVMEDQKLQVGTLEEDVSSAKALYSQALHSLEAISDEIHQKRLERRKHLQLGIRSAGVGAEDPAPPPSWDCSRIDGSTTPRRYSCNDSNNAVQSSVPSKDTNVNRKQSKTDVDTTDADVFSGSLLFSSPERARSYSYRTAIETSQTTLPVVSPVDSLCLADYDENFDVSSLEDDYMDLPKTHSPRGRVDPHANRAASNKSSSRTDHSVSLTVQDKMYHKQMAAQKSCPQSQPIAIKGHLSHIELKHEIQSAPESGSSHGSGSPSSLRKSPKLQGLILRVDPTMDPLQKAQTFKQTTHQHSRSKSPLTVSSRSGTNVPSSVVTGKPVSPNVSSSVGRIVAVSSAPVSNDPLNVSAVLGSSSQGSPARPTKIIKGQSDASSKVKSMMTGANNIKDADISSLSSPSYERKVLRLPVGTDMSQLSVEDSSDTESIASTGPMFDDDQIEFLSMDFSKQSIKDDLPDTTEPIYKRQSWSRMSLPPRLGYLEGYFHRKTSDTTIQKQIDENSQVLENISEQHSETVSNHVEEKQDSVNLETDPEASAIADSTLLKSVPNVNVEKTDHKMLALASGDSNNDQEKPISENISVDSLKTDSVDMELVSNCVQEEAEYSTVSDSGDLKPVTNIETKKGVTDQVYVKTDSVNTKTDIKSVTDDEIKNPIIEKLPVDSVHSDSVDTEQCSSHDGGNSVDSSVPESIDLETVSIHPVSVPKVESVE